MVCIGKVVKVRGNKGEVVIQTSPDIGFAGVERSIPVVLRSAKYTLSTEISTIREVNGQTVVRFTGIDSISQALKIVGYDILGEASSFPAAREKAILDVFGFAVWDISGGYWGTVERQEENEWNPLIFVRPPEGSLIAVPWHETIVRRVDRRSKKVVIDPPAGLKELNS